MKNVILTCVLVAGSFLKVMSQPYIFTAPATSLICPGALTNYKIIYPSGYSSCSVTWSITTGLGFFYNNITTGSNVDVTWDENKPNKVTIQAVVNYIGSGGSCSSSETATLTFTHTLRTVFGESITANTLPAVPYCTSSVNVSVDHMYIKNTGGIGQPPLTEVNDYQWTLPAGWRQSSTNNTGTFYTPLNAISIEPIPGGNCSIGGNIVVRGFAGLSSCAGQIVSQSNSKTIAITRTPVFTISASGGYNGQHQCGQTSPITFSVPAQSCTANYTWSFPSGWSGSSTSNSITLYPTGGTDVEGSITVMTSVNSGLCSITSPSFPITFSNPVISISGEGPVCTGGKVFTVDGVPPASSVWFTLSNGLVMSTGTNAVTLYAASSTYKGSGWLTANVYNSACNLSSSVTKYFWIGKPETPGSIIGSTSPTVGGTYAYSSLSDAPGATSYTWNAPTVGSPSWIVYGPINSLAVAMKVGSAYGYIKVTGINECGNGTPAMKYITPTSSGGGGGGGHGGGTAPRISFPDGLITKSQIISQLNEPEDYIDGIPNPYPNPATDELIVEYTHAKSEELVKNFMEKHGLDLYNPPYLEEAIGYNLIDLNGKIVIEARSNDTKFRMDVRNVPSGTYILGIQYGHLAVEKHKILIVK